MNYKDPENIQKFMEYQLAVLKKYACYIKDKMKTDYKHAALLVYWLDEYLTYLKAEKTFNPSMNITYRRGQIVFINFGYRIGTELGGNHYAVVIDTKNSRYSNTITVVPLKSKKAKVTKYSEIYHVPLGDCLGNMICDKSRNLYNELEQSQTTSNTDKKKLKLIRIANATMTYAQKLNKESVADIGQIITVSKQRIITPCHSKEPLANIILPKELMSLIDARLTKLYIDKNI